jgi:hypothetical protein
MFENENEIPSAPKKGRKRKTNVVSDGSLLMASNPPVETQNNINITISETEQSQNMNTFFSSPATATVVPVQQSDSIVEVKKRGRKPKGGKLIMKDTTVNETITTLPNIILHLKCSLKDLDVYKNKQNKMISKTLNYNPEIPPDIMTYNISDQKTNGLPYSAVETGSVVSVAGQNETPFTRDVAYFDATSTNPHYICSKCNSTSVNTEQDSSSHNNNEDHGELSVKNIMQKMKRLKIDLYKNSLLDKKSACFWCTYEYDSQVCFIPKYEMDGSICGYGSFCRPECAAAFLMKESIDDSTKFERYHLLNQIYSKVNDYKTNVKPAPDPHYLLDKYYGNLSIQEYRKLMNTDHIMLVIDKPLTRILPELHEDTDDFIIGIYGGTKGQGSTQAGGVYKVKRQSEKTSGPTKNSIMKGNFGLQQ